MCHYPSELKKTRPLRSARIFTIYYLIMNILMSVLLTNMFTLTSATASTVCLCKSEYSSDCNICIYVPDGEGPYSNDPVLTRSLTYATKRHSPYVYVNPNILVTACYMFMCQSVLGHFLSDPALGGPDTSTSELPRLVRISFFFVAK